MNCPYCKAPLMGGMTICPKCKYDVHTQDGGAKHKRWLIENGFAEPGEKEQLEKKEKALSEILITSGFNFEGYSIDRYCGYVSGSDVQSALPIDVVEKKGIIDSFETARASAIENIKLAAYNHGGNAIIGLSFSYLPYEPTVDKSHYYTVVTANGTAVEISKK